MLISEVPISNSEAIFVIEVKLGLFFFFFFFFFEKPPSCPPGYLGHSAHTPGSFSMSYAKTVLQINSYFLARLHTTYITIN